MKRKIIIGLVGKPLAWKETVGNIIINRLGNFRYVTKRRCLSKFNVKRHRFGDIMRETLEIWSLEKNRENLQKLAKIITAEDA